MRKSLFAKIAASAVAFTVVCLPLATDSTATSCDDIKFIFARGSGQKLEDEDYLAFKSSINAELSKQQSNLSTSFYELGSSSEYGAKYPAIALDFLTVLGAKVSAGNAFAFSESVKQGIIELKNYTELVSASCPGTRFVVAGYSQGAMLITNSLGELNPERFIYAATFGDPKLYLPEGKGVNPDACQGKNLSAYRIFAPNCHTYQGSLDGKIPYLENAWQSKVGLWCKDQDLVCGAGFSFGTPKTETDPLGNIIGSALHAHTRYPDDGVYEMAAKTIVGKIQSIYPERFGERNMIASNQDTIIMINYSAMYGYINYYRKIASAIAEETINCGGRVALWTYDDTQKSVKVVDFTTDYEDFSAYLWSTGSFASGGKERPDELLSALQNILDSANWSGSTAKNITLLTQSPLRDPDLNGITGETLKKTAQEKGSVSLYVISEFEDFGKTYLGLTREMGGDAFWDIDVTDISSIYPKKQSVSTKIKSTSKRSSIALATAKLETNLTEPQMPSVNNLKVIQKDGSIYIDYSLDENIIGLFVSLDDAPLGITNSGHLEITDLTKNATLNIKPISSDGIFGNSVSGEISYSPPDNSTPYVPQTGRK